MQQITIIQFDLLSNEIYDTLIGASIPCNCGETAAFGIGEMGEVRDAANLVIKNWCEKTGVTIKD